MNLAVVRRQPIGDFINKLKAYTRATSDGEIYLSN